MSAYSTYMSAVYQIYHIIFNFSHRHAHEKGWWFGETANITVTYYEFRYDENIPWHRKTQTHRAVRSMATSEDSAVDAKNVSTKNKSFDENGWLCLSTDRMQCDAKNYDEEEEEEEKRHKYLTRYNIKTLNTFRCLFIHMPYINVVGSMVQ